MGRITTSQVEAQLHYLNGALGRPTEHYTRGPAKDGTTMPTYTANVGHLMLSGAYGGWQVQEIASAGGGVRNLTQGYAPLREVSTFLDGMSAALSLLLPRDAYGRVVTWDVEYRAIPKEAGPTEYVPRGRDMDAEDMLDELRSIGYVNPVQIMRRPPR